jgi:hypothetical protein
LRHRYVSPDPPAVTEKLAVTPTQTVWATGCPLIEGAMFTVSATRFEVADGLQLPVTTQSKPVEATAVSPAAVPVICNVAAVAPL